MAMRYFPTHELLYSRVSVTSRLLPERARRADSCLWMGIPYASAMHREAASRCQAAEAQQTVVGSGSSGGQARTLLPSASKGLALASDVASAKRLCGAAEWGSAPLAGLGPPFLALEKDRGDAGQVPLTQPSLQGTAAAVPWSLRVLLNSLLNTAPWHMAMDCWTAGLRGGKQHTQCSGSILLPGSAVCVKHPIMPWIAARAMAALKRHIKALFLRQT